MADRVGQQMGNYRLLRWLGSGGFAEVYLAEQVYLKTQVALKVLDVSLHDEELDHFISEARLVASLRHPHIVQVHNFGLEGDVPYLVMEYAPNGTLRQRHPRGAQLPLATVVAYVQQIAGALDYAHAQRIIHRDIKPENILLNVRDEVLLSDFGVAVLTHSSRSLSTQDVAGTATYMAPEQFLGKPQPASDQYALGMVVYEWLAGQPAFQGSFLEISGQHLHMAPPALRECRPDLPAQVEEVVQTALAKDPKERFARVQAFANALALAAQDAPTSMPLARSSGLLSRISQPETTPQPTIEDSSPGGLFSEQTLPATLDERRSAPGEATPPASTPPAGSALIAETWTESSARPAAPTTPLQPARQLKRRPVIVGIGAALLLLMLLTVALGVNYVQGQALLHLDATQTTQAQHTAQTAALNATGTAQAQSASATAASQQATQTALNATATAEHIPPTLPYRVQVPGPCGASNAAWSTDTPRALDCQSDRLTMKSDGSGADMTFTLSSFPSRYIVSIDVSNVVGDRTSITLTVNGKPAGYGFAFVLGPGNTIFLVTSQGNTGGGPEESANINRTNTIALSINGSAGRFLLNGNQVNADNVGVSWTTINIMVNLTGDPGAQADIQNFVIIPN